MADMDKVLAIMPLAKAMCMYGSSDKEKFECSYPEYQAKRPDTTFYADFSVADVYGEKAIQDTYNRCFNGWKDNVKYFTEFVGALNHKLWAWHEAGIEEYAKLYDKLWKKADAFGCEHFKDEDASHFFSVLDQYIIKVNKLHVYLRPVEIVCSTGFFVSIDSKHLTLIYQQQRKDASHAN